MVCRKCGSPLKAGDLFCMYCGTKVVPEGSATPPPPPASKPMSELQTKPYAGPYLFEREGAFKKPPTFFIGASGSKEDILYCGSGRHTISTFNFHDGRFTFTKKGIYFCKYILNEKYSWNDAVKKEKSAFFIPTEDIDGLEIEQKPLFRTYTIKTASSDYTLYLNHEEEFLSTLGYLLVKDGSGSLKP